MKIVAVETTGVWSAKSIVENCDYDYIGTVYPIDLRFSQ